MTLAPTSAILAPPALSSTAFTSPAIKAPHNPQSGNEIGSPNCIPNTFVSTFAARACATEGSGGPDATAGPVTLEGAAADPWFYAVAPVSEKSSGPATRGTACRSDARHLHAVDVLGLQAAAADAPVAFFDFVDLDPGD